jgi:uncharacterized membrane protein YedE/YeeE
VTVILGLAVVIPLGYTLQRGGFCMNTAFRSLVFERDLSVFRGYVLILLINLVAVHLLDEFAIITITMAPFFWPAILVGGFVFGIGMVLAGGCTSGSCYRAGKGMVGSFVALLGFAIGATTMGWGLLRPVQVFLRGPVLDVYGQEATLYNIIPVDHPAVKWIVIGVATVLGGVWLLRAPKQKYQVGWGWRRTGLALGVLSVLAWIASGATGRDYGLSVTQPTVSLFRYFTAGEAGGINWGTYLVIGLVGGAFLAALVAREFSLRLPSPGRLLQQFGGGLLMGLGASVAGGCNIGHGITGVSVLAVSSLVATFFTILGVWAMTWVIYRGVGRTVQRAAAAEGVS